jgi:serine/threonine protein kinase
VNLNPDDFNFAFLKASDIDFGEELGSGSFGTVFKGTYNGRPVAIKVSKPGVEEALRDFLREAEVMMKIEPHPNVIQLSTSCPAGFAPTLDSNMFTFDSRCRVKWRLRSRFA